MVALILAHRVGFLVDAAIFGFAVGAGFAAVENLHYLGLAPDAGMGTWIVRGFGTAIMHGGATAIFAVMGLAMRDRSRRTGPAAFLPASPSRPCSLGLQPPPSRRSSPPSRSSSSCRRFSTPYSREAKRRWEAGWARASTRIRRCWNSSTPGASRIRPWGNTCTPSRTGSAGPWWPTSSATCASTPSLRCARRESC
ncbi:MAG: PrsW family intramembrane metalloprotease [Betaproteobacteria bacterium]|nr:PrsW family intramembrane metalloprotease [Betaproteobacteria bacterium]